MRRLVSPAFFLALAVLAGYVGTASDPSPAEAVSARAKACEFSATRTIRRSREVRIFYFFRGQRGVLGCHYTRGRAYELKGYARGREAPGSLPSAESLRISGSFAGYEIRQGRFGASRTQAINLRTGRLARNAYNGGGEQRDPALGVTDLELSRTGSIAWILAIQDTEGIRGEVRIGPRGLPLEQATTIDRGPDVDLRSLVLRGTTLYWTNAGVRRSVTLR